MSVVKDLLLQKSMALQDQHQAINQTAEALSSCERRRIFYLCEILDTDTSVACMKDMLKSKVTCHERGHLFLTELMLQLRRFDILRKVYNTSRDEVEQALIHRKVLPRFRVLMANLNEDMANEDLNSVKFLLSSTLPREKMEKVQSFLDVIIELEKLDIVSPERVDFVEQCFRNIGRVDLAKKVTAYKMSVTSEGHSSLQQRHRYPFPNPNGSHSLQQTSQACPFHNATENLPVLVPTEQNLQTCWNRHSRLFTSTCSSTNGCVWMKSSQFSKSYSERERTMKATALSAASLAAVWQTISWVQTRTAQVYIWTMSDVFSLLTHAPCWRESPNSSSSRDADVFWSHCWTDERQLEQGHHRSTYLKALTDALHKGQRRKTHLVDVHTEVNGAIFEHNERNPGAQYNIDLKHTLRKDLYL
ncbi:uncharacterized protein LOC117750145 isoform X4 [Cyclopterus lumpus]|uniref:uncharacterized protein LOC117750145 isoform X4 n=1 Tax=Cyclopterus lumpus TaxID=8103 RepID=UPI00148636A0|nr:uncharacterized protein LOC117750145 isoform X4 [Cyclopterus lumpus]